MWEVRSLSVSNFTVYIHKIQVPLRNQSLRRHRTILQPHDRIRTQWVVQGLGRGGMRFGRRVEQIGWDVVCWWGVCLPVGVVHNIPVAMR